MTKEEQQLLASMGIPKRILDAEPEKVTATSLGLLNKPRKHRTVSEFYAARLRELGYELKPAQPTRTKGT